MENLEAIISDAEKNGSLKGSPVESLEALEVLRELVSLEHRQRRLSLNQRNVVTIYLNQMEIALKNPQSAPALFKELTAQSGYER